MRRNLYFLIFGALAILAAIAFGPQSSEIWVIAACVFIVILSCIIARNAPKFADRGYLLFYGPSFRHRKKHLVIGGLLIVAAIIWIPLSVVIAPFLTPDQGGLFMLVPAIVMFVIGISLVAMQLTAQAMRTLGWKQLDDDE